MSAWRSRSTVPVQWVQVEQPKGRVATLRVREMAVRVPPSTPGAWPSNGKHWLACQVVIGPREAIGRACADLGLSAALSWLATQWSIAQGLDVGG